MEILPDNWAGFFKNYTRLRMDFSTGCQFEAKDL